MVPKQRPSKPSQIKQLPTKDCSSLGAWACHQIPRVVDRDVVLGSGGRFTYNSVHSILGNKFTIYLLPPGAPAYYVFHTHIIFRNKIEHRE